MAKIKINQKYINKYKLDKDEVETLEAFENGELKSINNLEEELAQFREAFKDIAKTLQKDKSIHLRLNSGDIELIKAKSKQDGIPYQTILGSIIHQFANRIREKGLDIAIK
jgi:predicted DNA binding CopG/RHH family protein